MIIKMTPQRRDDTLTITKVGKVLIVNGDVFDFGPMNDGDTLPSSAIDSQWFSGDITCENGNLTVCVILPLPINYSPEQAFPKDLVDVADGVVMLPQPLIDKATEDEVL